MEEKNLLPIEIKDGIFDKILRFFKNLFKPKSKIDTIETIVEQKEDDKKEISNDFVSSLKMDAEQRAKTLQLQEYLEKGLVNKYELTEEECDQLQELYNEQIIDLKNEIKLLKIELNSYNKRIATANAQN